MDTITINNTNLKDEKVDKRVNKVRAILVRENKILMSRYAGLLLFPGGKRQRKRKNHRSRK